MKNADMPAMPQAATESGHGCNYNGYNGTGVPTGLTKREMMAMHICSAITGSIHNEECYMRIKAMSDNCGVKVSEWIARDAVKQANALLAELEKQQ